MCVCCLSPMFACYHPWGVNQLTYIGVRPLVGVIYIVRRFYVADSRKKADRPKRSYFGRQIVITSSSTSVQRSSYSSCAVCGALSLAQQLGTDQNRPSPLKLATLRRSALSTTASRAVGPYRVRVGVGVRVI